MNALTAIRRVASTSWPGWTGAMSLGPDDS
jgi:hypothetical protein